MPDTFSELFNREYGTENSCPKNRGKKHIPNWRTTTTDHDGSSFYLDVTCKYCGRSGCVGSLKKLEESVNW
jgi:hypothetical protein